MSQAGILAVLLLAAQLQAGDAWSATLPRPIGMSEWLGMNVPYEIYPDRSDAGTIAALRELGVRHIRAPIHWNVLEPGRGSLMPEFAARIAAFHGRCAAAGIGILLYPAGSPAWNTTAPAGEAMADRYPPRDLAPFIERMAWLARQPAVEAMQVWNEPNIPAFWAPKEDPKAYGDMLGAALPVLRGSAPRMQVLTAGMAYWSIMPQRGGFMFLELAERGLLRAVDGCSYHPYLHRPEGDDGQPPTSFTDTAAVVNSQLRAAGAKRIWVTEAGWSTYDGPREDQPLIDERIQAAYLVRRLLLLLASDVDRVYWFALADFPQGWKGRDAAYGLIRADGNRKPAFAALLRLISQAGPRLKPAPLPVVLGRSVRYSVSALRADGRRLIGIWALEDGEYSLPGVVEADVLDPVTGTGARIRDPAGITVRLEAGIPLLVTETSRP